MWGTGAIEGFFLGSAPSGHTWAACLLNQLGDVELIRSWLQKSGAASWSLLDRCIACKAGKTMEKLWKLAAFRERERAT